MKYAISVRYFKVGFALRLELKKISIACIKATNFEQSLFYNFNFVQFVPSVLEIPQSN